MWDDRESMQKLYVGEGTANMECRKCVCECKVRTVQIGKERGLGTKVERYTGFDQMRVVNLRLRISNLET